jgi:pantoate--beta-alanine ligase
MRVVDEPAALRMECQAARRAGHVLALVPTMGALHRGHLELVDEARRRAAQVVVSIFVNPTQFGPKEDFARYPRTLEADLERCREHGVDLVFAPEARAMYPAGEETRVHVGAMAAALCGPHRPGHFEGVCTVVAKLFALTGRSIAVFGRKDYQQLRIIQRMVTDLFLPVELVGHPTVREPDGLALSSRNRYLDPDERRRALAIPRGLSAAVEAFARGERRAAELTALVTRELASAADSIDYVELADPNSVVPFTPGEESGDRALLAVAARFGATRLIDNVVLGEDRAPLTDGA